MLAEINDLLVTFLGRSSHSATQVRSSLSIKDRVRS